MTYRRWFSAGLFFFSAAGACAIQATDCRNTSSKLLDNLDRGNYAIAGADFDAKMKTLTPERLQSFWENLPHRWGARGARDDARLVRKDGNDIVVTPIHFGDEVANAVVVCSPAGQIAGFHVFPQP